jgi:nucleoside-diphosphate-sugar epimerase
VVRFGGIYGPGRTRLIDSVRSGQARCEPGLYTNRIHRDDCAGVLEHLLALAAPAPLYIGVDDEPALQCEVLRWLAQQLGVPPPVPSGAPDDSRRRGGNKRCCNARLRASGYRLLYPSYCEGYTALLRA